MLWHFATGHWRLLLGLTKKCHGFRAGGHTGFKGYSLKSYHMYILIRGKLKIIITPGRNKCYLPSLAVQVSMVNVQHSSVTFECSLNVLSRGLKETRAPNNLTSPREEDRQTGSCCWCVGSAQVTLTQERVASFGKWQHVKQVPSVVPTVLVLGKSTPWRSECAWKEWKKPEASKVDWC